MNSYLDFCGVRVTTELVPLTSLPVAVCSSEGVRSSPASPTDVPWSKRKHIIWFSTVRTSEVQIDVCRYKISGQRREGSHELTTKLTARRSKPTRLLNLHLQIYIRHTTYVRSHSLLLFVYGERYCKHTVGKMQRRVISGGDTHLHTDNTPACHSAARETIPLRPRRILFLFSSDPNLFFS